MKNPTVIKYFKIYDPWEDLEQRIEAKRRSETQTNKQYWIIIDLDALLTIGIITGGIFTMERH